MQAREKTRGLLEDLALLLEDAILLPEPSQLLVALRALDASADETERVARLVDSLRSGPPSLPSGEEFSEEVRTVLDTFRVLADADPREIGRAHV